MSTASPLPLQPLPDAPISNQQQSLLKHEVALRLQQHRRRRPQAAQQTLPDFDVELRPRSGSGVADSVAARFAQKASYRDLLAQEAEAAMRQAEAAAEVARRNADAILNAQQQLLDEITLWDQAAAEATAAERVPEAGASSRERAMPAQVLPFAETTHTAAGHGSEVESFTPMRASTAPAHTPVAAQTVSTDAKQAVGTGSQAVTTDATSSAGLQQVETSTIDPILLLKQEPKEPPTGLPTNLIEFPRQLVAARKARPRLAEGPLLEEANRSSEQAQLRIFEVEPESFSTVPLPVQESVLPEWSSIRLDNWTAPHETATPDAQTSLAMPLYTAAVSTRCMAAAVDACCVGAVFLAAVATAGYASPVLPTGVLGAVAAVGTLGMLGVLYLLLFFTFTDATPGMRYARIALCTFNDDNPTRSAMRRRLLATALSVVPMGLGLLWAALDDDRLGWHDRISRTYQREY